MLVACEFQRLANSTFFALLIHIQPLLMSGLYLASKDIDETYTLDLLLTFPKAIANSFCHHLIQHPAIVVEYTIQSRNGWRVHFHGDKYVVNVVNIGGYNL